MADGNETTERTETAGSMTPATQATSASANGDEEEDEEAVSASRAAFKVRVDEAVAALDPDFVPERGWRYGEISVPQGEGQKPWVAAPGRKIGPPGAKRASLYFLVGAKSVEEGVRTPYQMHEETDKVAASLVASGMPEAEAKKQARSEEFRPCVPLFNVLRTVEHRRKLVTDTAYADSYALMDTEQDCGINMDGCAGKVKVSELCGYNRYALMAVAEGSWPRNPTVPELARYLLSLLAEAWKSKSQLVVCQSCVTRTTTGMPRRIRVDEEHSVNVVVSARQVIEWSIRGQNKAQAARADTSNTLDELKSKKPLTATIGERSDQRGGRRDGGGRGQRHFGRQDRQRGDQRGRGYSHDDR